MIRNEIGSEFWDVPIANVQNHLFPENTKWFISGRGALSFIIDDIVGTQRFHTIALPSWCCFSMIKPFVDAGLKVEFYSPFKSTKFMTDAVLIMDYFGYTGGSAIDKYEGVVIRDVTQSLFSVTYTDANYYFGSLRKWAGFWTGGFAWGKWNNNFPIESVDDEYMKLRKIAMEQKKGYIERAHSSKEYLNTFKKAEELLTYQKITTGAVRDTTLARRLDVDFIRSRRRENAKVLLDKVRELAIFQEIKETDCPMFVPIRVQDGKRDQLRNHLISKDIYCPVHWPVSEFNILDESSRIIYEEELSLVCDQRYSVLDMGRICEAIDEFFGNGTKSSLLIN